MYSTFLICIITHVLMHACRYRDGKNFAHKIYFFHFNLFFLFLIIKKPFFILISQYNVSCAFFSEIYKCWYSLFPFLIIIILFFVHSKILSLLFSHFYNTLCHMTWNSSWKEIMKKRINSCWRQIVCVCVGFTFLCMKI